MAARRPVLDDDDLYWLVGIVEDAEGVADAREEYEQLSFLMGLRDRLNGDDKRRPAIGDVSDYQRGADYAERLLAALGR